MSSTETVSTSLTLVYNIKEGRRRTLASIEDFRHFTGLNDDLMNDARISTLLELANRRIRAMTGRTINGTVNKELLGRADGVCRDYFLMFKPVLNTQAEAGGEVTKSPADIKVYTLDQLNDDGFTLLHPSTYLFNGESGHIMFKKDSLPQSGLDIYCSYYYDTELLKQAEMSLAASWAFGQMAPTENRDNRPTRYKAEFDELMQNYVGEDHYFTATSSAESKDASTPTAEQATGPGNNGNYYAEKY